MHVSEELRERTIYKVTLIGSAVNLILSIGKILAGVFGQSAAMIADGIHSISDFATDIVVLLFVKVSTKPKDHNHAYGHGKFETLATIIIGLALLAVGIGILVNGIGDINKVRSGEILARPGMIALLAAFASILAKEGLYWYTVIEGRRIISPAVIANAWHHRSDAFSSLATLVGIGGAHFLGEEWRILDPIAALLVALLILKVAYDLIMPGIHELLESSLPKETEDEILSIVLKTPDIHDPHSLKTRRIGAAIAIELHVRVEGYKTVTESHDLTIDIERNLKEHYGSTTQVVIHVEPLQQSP